MTARKIAESMLIAAIDLLNRGETTINLSASITTSVEGYDQAGQEVSVIFDVNVEEGIDLTETGDDGDELFDDSDELNAIGDKEGDDIEVVTRRGVTTEGNSVTITEAYGVNADGQPTETITRMVTVGDSVIGTITIIVTDSDGTRFISSVADLNGELIAEGDDAGDAAAG